MQVRLQLRYRETGDLGDFVVALLLEDLPGEDRALAVVAGRERSVEDAAELFVEELVFRRPIRIALRHLGHLLDRDHRPPPLRAKRLVRDVLRDPEEPRRELR